jgi:large-conductance mechanosensitive channel
MFDEILNFIKQEFSSVLSLVVGVIIGLIASPIIKTLFKAIKYLVALKDLGRLEKTYSSVLKYAKKNLKELGLILNKLPEEIVVETTYKDDVALFSRFRAFFKKNIVGKLRGKEILSINIFGNMSYEEQIAFIIQKAFEAIISSEYEKVLGVDFRDSLVTYYSYKFAFLSQSLVGKGVTLMLERKRARALSFICQELPLFYWKTLRCY